MTKAHISVEDVVYHVADGADLMATIYRPDVPIAAMVSVHGGRWCAETRLTNAVIDRALAEAGVLTMAIDFRMPPAVRYPVPVAEINLAIRWLKLRAATMGIPENMIGGIGTSSGGHQLLLNALLPCDHVYAHLALPEGSNIEATLAFAIACWPVADPLARYRFAVARGITLHVESHHAYWPDEAAMSAGSPQRLVETGEATHLPPLLLIQGTADTVLPPDTADRFATAYRAAGGAVTLEMYESAPHTFITKSPETPQARTALRSLVSFVRDRASGAARTA